MVKKALKKIVIRCCGREPAQLHQELRNNFNSWSIRHAVRETGTAAMTQRLRLIVPDISQQEESERIVFNRYCEAKRRALQAFQCALMLKAFEGIPFGKITVVDIGDSAGTHMLYLAELAKGKYKVETISVNLDTRAIKKIEERGLKALLCRAEDLDLGSQKVDLFTSFQMIEHLHNPALFFRRLAKKAPRSRFLITVPYLKYSRVGLHNIRNGLDKIVFAEDQHVFELSPEDWTLLMRHAGWKVIYSRIYYQYPRRWPFLSQFLSYYWQKNDYEGFWGAILESDTTFSDRYQDWGE
jgi:2-polyprenyl-3-methyl-5-hydroxy-6-metoxy-1,4-benzoquinol methylase